ncbi:MAG: ATP-binding cassette domain-containing protein [Bacilli bacterium]|nr:ATP-binding cassette domain-containing protein [Bacilli bacterium]
MASISLRHIFKEYPHTAKERKKEEEKNISPFAVRDFNLEIKDGEFVVLVGPSGCGKSTTLRMIAGLEDISGGELYIDDVLSNNVDASKRNIAMVFQNYALYPHMTSYGNMAYGLKLRKVSKTLRVVDKDAIKALKQKRKETKDDEELKRIDEEIESLKNNPSKEKTVLVHYTKAEIDEKIQKAAEILDIKHLLDRKPSDMSGGQRQRVALGRALVREPKVFLLDEPLSNLDAKLRASMRSEIVKLHRTVKTTFVYVTHDQIEAMTMGEKIVVMKDGVIQQVGAPSVIYDKPLNKFVAGFIGTPQMNFFNVKLKAGAKDVHITLPNNKEISFKLDELRKIKDEYITGEEKEVILGIRGENISLNNKKGGIDAQVVFAEMLGNTTNIICKLDDSTDEFNISIQDRTELKPGDKVSVSFNATAIHLFDKENEETIYLSEGE